MAEFYTLTDNTCIHINEISKVDINQLNLGISQDFGIYAYYQCSDSCIAYIFPDGVIDNNDLRLIKCDGGSKCLYDSTTKVDKDNNEIDHSDFIGEAFIERELTHINCISWKTKLALSNTVGSVDGYNEVNNIYTNYTGICTHICSNYECEYEYFSCYVNHCSKRSGYLSDYIGYSNCESKCIGSLRIKRDLMYYTDAYNCNNTSFIGVPTPNQLIFGSDVVHTSDTNLHEYYTNAINNNATISLSLMRDAFNCYVSTLPKGTKWKFYDNAVITYCRDTEFHYINVVKYSYSVNNPVYRIVLPVVRKVSTSDNNTYNVCYQNLGIRYSANILTIDTTFDYSHEGGTSSGRTVERYRLFYDTNGSVNPVTSILYDEREIPKGCGVSGPIYYHLYGNYYKLDIDTSSNDVGTITHIGRSINCIGG